MIKNNHWFTQMGNLSIIGIVITEDDITGEKKARIGTSRGQDETLDAEFIVSTGAMMHVSMIESILEQVSDVSIKDIETNLGKIAIEVETLKRRNRFLERRNKKLNNIIDVIKKGEKNGVNISVMTSIFDFVEAYENQLGSGLLAVRDFAKEYFKSISKNGRRKS